MTDTLDFHELTEQHSIGKSVFLHLIPALIWLVFYFPLARIASRNNIPTMFIMYLLAAFILLPFELGYLLYRGKKKNKRLSLRGIILFKEKMPWWQYGSFGLLTVVWIVLVMFSFGSKLADFFRVNVFSWVPDWFYLSRGTPEQNGAFIEIMMWAFGLVFIALLGPLVEELYFRGYLLPRLSRLGKWAPLLNVVLFISYHFWQPHFFLTGIISMLPFVYFVWWKRNVYLGIGIHCFINTFGWIADLIRRLSS